MRKYFPLLMLTVLLPACGLKGPLYLPQQTPVISQSAPAQPATAAGIDDRISPAPAPSPTK